MRGKNMADDKGAPDQSAGRGKADPAATDPKGKAADPAGTDPGAAAADEKKFSQADMDKAIADRLAREQKKNTDAAAKAKVEADEAARIAALQGEEKLKAEHAAALKKAQEESKAAQDELRITKAKAALLEAKLSPDFAAAVVGDTDDATAANIAKLSKMVSDEVKKQVDDAVHKGAPASGKPPAPGDDIRDTMFKGAGIKQEKK